MKTSQLELGKSMGAGDVKHELSKLLFEAAVDFKENQDDEGRQRLLLLADAWVVADEPAIFEDTDKRAGKAIHHAVVRYTHATGESLKDSVKRPLMTVPNPEFGAIHSDMLTQIVYGHDELLGSAAAYARGVAMGEVWLEQPEPTALAA